MSTPISETPPEQRSIADLFRFSTWLHVGAGADACADVDEEKGEVNCGDPHHFHAWLTLPNQFQHREIREKALAAKARKARQMRMEGTDAYEVLEEELDYLLRQGESAREALIQEIVGKDWWRDYLEAGRDVQESVPADAPEDAEPTFKGIEHDRARLQEIEAKPEDEREGDEYEELRAHVAAYHAAVAKRAEEIMQPQRDALAARPIAELVDLIRSDRIDKESNEEFTHVYNVHSWFVGTRRTPGPVGERYYQALSDMQAAPASVIDAIQATFTDMERTAREVGTQGNS